MLMDNTDYQILKNKILLQPTVYREVDKNEIVAVDETHYRVGNAVVEFSPEMAEDMDRFVGLKNGQSKLAQDSYGDSGVANLRNFFSQARHKRNEKIVLVADTETKSITSVHQTPKHLIPPEAFFNFAEMFMDKNRYEPDAIDFGQGSEISIRMHSLDPQIMSFAKGDDFISDGVWMNWTPVEIAVGNYYERLVCRNGMTQVTQNSQMHIDSLDDEPRVRMLLGNSNSFLRQNLALMLKNAQLAIETQASVRELGLGAKILQHSGIEPEMVAKLIPYKENVEKYEKAGYPINSEGLAMAVSDMTVWDEFNVLTAFASHNKVWRNHDIRRTMLMTQSVNFLNRKRDIRKQYNVYESAL